MDDCGAERSVSSVEAGDGKVITKVGVKSLTIVQAVNDALRTMLKEREDVILLGEDIGKNGGVFRATEGLLEEFGEERVDGHAVKRGRIYWCSDWNGAWWISSCRRNSVFRFIYPAYEQIMTHAARMRARTRGHFTVPLVIRAPYGAGVRAPEIHSDSTEALFTPYARHQSRLSRVAV